jgi:hypothetical protein
MRQDVPVNYNEILNALRDFTSRERIEFRPLAPAERTVSDYAPIRKYVLDLKNEAKPETAANFTPTAAGPARTPPKSSKPKSGAFRQ